MTTVHTRPTRCLRDTASLPGADASGRPAVEVVERFAFKANDYYTSLIDWDDPQDPIRRLVIPCDEELVEFGSLDASNEAANTPVAGVQHKYRDTVLLLVTDQCSCFCRYCFRKRLFLPGSRETHRDCREGLEYIASHPEITDVLLTGGDPLSLSSAYLRGTVEQILEIPHVRTIRIGSKTPAFNPYRIIDDPELPLMVRDVVERGRSFYLMAHFDHPRELTLEAVSALAMLKAAGAMCLNQCPITRGINDDAEVLASLLQICTDVGCPQYYMFQCRPTTGAAHFALPLVRAFDHMARARESVSGLSRRVRFCASHESGKIEIVGVDERHIYARYHRAKRPEDAGRFVVYRRDDEALWLDQLLVAEQGA
ncbi:MAG TPA: KamA family radical SAM protein [Thermoleophilia bacterium]|nr:KamA family radical SAM protein [Thermoleophilia bacterium]